MSDNISRQAAIRWVKTESNPYGKPTLDFESGKKVIEHLKQMPSAEPKTGKWKYTKFHTWGCSQCKKNPTKGLGYVQSKDELFDFCPNCGARMVREDGEE